MKNILRECRESLGMPQEKLSEISTVSRTTISDIETGKKVVVTNVTLEKLANALGKKITDIFFKE
jgi:transcriptional regulator with XRE-family HTH domain